MADENVFEFTGEMVNVDVTDTATLLFFMNKYEQKTGKKPVKMLVHPDVHTAVVLPDGWDMEVVAWKYVHSPKIIFLGE